MGCGSSKEQEAAEPAKPLKRWSTVEGRHQDFSFEIDQAKNGGPDTIRLDDVGPSDAMPGQQSKPSIAGTVSPRGTVG